MELQDVLETAGTCRHFRPDPVPDDLLAAVLDAARWAPQGGNRQPVRVVVVRDPATRLRLADLYREGFRTYLDAAAAGTVRVGARSRPLQDATAFAAHLHEVPVLLVVCAIAADLHVTDTGLGRTSVVGGASIYPAVQNLLLKCRDLGLGAALTTLLCEKEPEVKELLGIPDGVITAAHVAVGWPARPLPTRLRRAPLSRMVFDGRYGRSWDTIRPPESSTEESPT